MGQWCLHHGRKTWWPTDNQGASANFRARRVPGTSPAASTSFFLTGNPLPSGYVKICYWKWPFIVDLPINSMVIFHGYVSLPEGMKQTLQQISRNFNKWHRWIMTSIWKNLPIHLICHAFPNDDTSWQYCCPTTQTEVDGPWRIWDHQSLTNRSTSFRIKIFLCLGMSPGSHPGPTRVPPGSHPVQFVEAVQLLLGGRQELPRNLSGAPGPAEFMRMFFDVLMGLDGLVFERSSRFQ